MHNTHNTAYNITRALQGATAGVEKIGSGALSRAKFKLEAENLKASTESVKASTRGANAQATIAEAELKDYTSPLASADRTQARMLGMYERAWNARSAQLDVSKLSQEITALRLGNQAKRKELNAPPAVDDGLTDKDRSTLEVLQRGVRNAAHGPLGNEWVSGLANAKIDPNNPNQTIAHLYGKSREWVLAEVDAGRLVLPAGVPVEAVALMAATSTFEKFIAPLAAQALNEPTDTPGWWETIANLGRLAVPKLPGSAPDYEAAHRAGAGLTAGAVEGVRLGGNFVQDTWDKWMDSGAPGAMGTLGANGWGRAFYNKALASQYDQTRALDQGDMDALIDATLDAGNR